MLFSECHNPLSENAFTVTLSDNILQLTNINYHVYLLF